MRDEAQLLEDAPATTSQRTVAWFTALALLGAASIFGLGFVIGGRMARLDIAHEPMIDPIARLDVQRKLHDDLTFYDALTAKQKVRTEPVTTGGAAAVPTPPAASKQPTNAPALAAAPSAAGKPAGSGKSPPVPALKSAPAQAAEASKPAVARAPGAAGLHEGPARPGEFTIQVSSYQSHEEARAFCGALERKGFRPFVVKTDLGPRGTWYRVRIGRFVDEAKAKQAKQTLAQSDIPSWVLRTE